MPSVLLALSLLTPTISGWAEPDRLGPLAMQARDGSQLTVGLVGQLRATLANTGENLHKTGAS